jgi:hypothetical protein
MPLDGPGKTGFDMEEAVADETWSQQGSSCWQTNVELEFQHVMGDWSTPDSLGPRPDRLHPGLNLAVTAISTNGLFAWLPDGTVVHADWSVERQCFIRRDGLGDLPLTAVRAWAALPLPIAKF